MAYHLKRACAYQGPNHCSGMEARGKVQANSGCRGISCRGDPGAAGLTYWSGPVLAGVALLGLRSLGLRQLDCSRSAGLWCTVQTALQRRHHLLGLLTAGRGQRSGDVAPAALGSWWFAQEGAARSTGAGLPAAEGKAGLPATENRAGLPAGGRGLNRLQGRAGVRLRLVRRRGCGLQDKLRGSRFAGGRSWNTLRARSRACVALYRRKQAESTEASPVRQRGGRRKPHKMPLSCVSPCVQRFRVRVSLSRLPGSCRAQRRAQRRRTGARGRVSLVKCDRMDLSRWVPKGVSPIHFDPQKTLHKGWRLCHLRTAYLQRDHSLRPCACESRHLNLWKLHM